MTKAFDPSQLQFYVTIPSPCPYLTDRMERKVFTQLDPMMGPYLNDYLTHSGFRRSQNVIYRPACENCSACKSLRVEVKEFTDSRNMRKTLSRNQDLSREICEPYATREQFELLQRYLNHRHPDGGMTDMTFPRFETMVEDCTSRTFIIEYRDTENTLVAACLVDELSDGLSMVYSFFDPEQPRRGLGIYMILDHIALTRAQSLPFLYLGYWVKNSPKMDYKARFKPAQILTELGWTDLKD